VADGSEIDADYVVCRLEEAGATLLALPNTGYSTRLRTSSLDILRSELEAYGWTDEQIRPSVPSAEKITRMDEAMNWISLIPLGRYLLRRVVGARSLVHPVTDRHLFPWRRLGKALGADHKAIQRWHAQGIGMIVAALRPVPSFSMPAAPSLRGLGRLTLLGLAAGRSEAIRPASAISSLRGG
jgi:hypothetical protein